MTSSRSSGPPGQWILASSSPRRVELLGAMLALPLRVVAAQVEELHDSILSPAALTLANARLKARAVSDIEPAALCLGADTLVYLDGMPLGKPRDGAEASAMLLSLAGREHQVCTSVWCSWIEGGIDEGFSELSMVKMRPLSLDEVQHYHRLVNPLDKAGAYGIQSQGDLIIAGLHGSFNNVMGLPTEALRRWLVARGWEALLRV